MKQQGFAVLIIASPRCNHHCWHLLPTTETSLQIQEKRPTRQGEVMLLHDNARPHSANLARNTIQELGWEVITHPPYSPDLVTSDFHLPRSLSNNLQGISSADENVLRTRFDNLNSKPRDLYRCWIEKLLQRWQNVVNSEGEYIVDDWFLSYVCIWCGQ